MPLAFIENPRSEISEIYPADPQRDPRSRGVREARPHGAQSSGSAVSTSTDTMTDDDPPQRLTMSLIERCTSGSRSSREAEERYIRPVDSKSALLDRGVQHDDDE